MVVLHESGERHARPSNPLASRSRALLAFHGRRRYYPDGDDDRARFVDNERVPGALLEARFPTFETADTPVMVDDRNALEAYTRAWIDDDKEIDDRDATVVTFATSITCHSVKERGVPPFPGARFTCGGAYKICKHNRETKEKIHFDDKSITHIPACMVKHANLKRFDLSRTNVSRIENLDKLVKLKLLMLAGTPVSRIENLDKNVKLKILGLDRTKVSRIEKLDTLVKLEILGLEDTKVSKIENLDKLVKLEKLWLGGTDVIRIENLEKNVKLKSLDLDRTKVPDGDKRAFEASRRKPQKIIVT